MDDLLVYQFALGHLESGVGRVAFTVNAFILLLGMELGIADWANIVIKSACIWRQASFNSLNVCIIQLIVASR